MSLEGKEEASIHYVKLNLFLAVPSGDPDWQYEDTVSGCLTSEACRLKMTKFEFLRFHFSDCDMKFWIYSNQFIF